MPPVFGLISLPLLPNSYSRRRSNLDYFYAHDWLSFPDFQTGWWKSLEKSEGVQFLLFQCASKKLSWTEILPFHCFVDLFLQGENGKIMQCLSFRAGKLGAVEIMVQASKHSGHDCILHYSTFIAWLAVWETLKNAKKHPGQFLKLVDLLDLVNVKIEVFECIWVYVPSLLFSGHIFF